MLMFIGKFKKFHKLIIRISPESDNTMKYSQWLNQNDTALKKRPKSDIPINYYG